MYTHYLLGTTSQYNNLNGKNVQFLIALLDQQTDVKFKVSQGTLQDIMLFIVYIIDQVFQV